VTGTARRAAAGLGCLVLASTVLGGCTGGAEPPDEGARNGSAPSGTSEPAEEDVGEPGLAEFFGPDVRPRQDGSFGLDRWTLVDTGTDIPPGRALQVSYPEGSVSPAASREHGAPGGGMQVFLPMTGEPVDAAHLRYWVRLPDDFDFAKGGKLPGLYGGTEVSGGEEPDGTDGFSTRLMWRTDGAGELYLYAPGESGTSLGRGNWTWPSGEWTCVEEQVVLNEPGADDGSVTVWVDGQEVLAQEDLEFRTVDDLRIEGIFFSTFFGGADPSWASPRDQHAGFAGFAVSADRLGCAG